MMIRTLLASLCLLSLSALPLQAIAGDFKDKAPVVVELFTSQGCSSCPPADRLLEELATMPHVIALSLPVTYWDYLGWKDKFAKPQHDQRQRSYARQMNERRVYTPQMVIQGQTAIVGHNRAKARQAIASHSTDAAQVAIQLTIQGTTQLNATLTGKPAKADIWLAEFSRQEVVDISRGENSGRRLTYTNVVRQMTKLGNWQPPRQTLQHALPHAPTSAIGYALFLQDRQTGQIIAAAQVLH